ncbi:hypothetical protein [Acidocella sp. KAb 2-4]|uniref:hypothetical protein n=1 Tax=Acidocella sp. KAb 2-4 TaxID=2885158 RepID=UPI001D063095|nr:hypothetical protein [Acidocella sp. KAb 2-4]MCB5945214.1 hypothetical protein [Acidocella sp. KAb 2-4]
MKKLLAILPLGALAACSSAPTPMSFAPLDYSYLRPITLNVANLNVVNNYVPSPSEATLEAQDPVPLAATLVTMLQHRLQPSGTPGTGTVTVQVVSITEAGGNLNGAMTVDVNLTSADGRSTAFTEASVTASQTAPDSNSGPDMQAALYQMTKTLMTQMNVQLPYQIMHNIPSWVVGSAAGGAAPGMGGAAGGIIQAAPLSAPGGAAAPATGTPPVAAPVNTNAAVPNYLPGAGPAALGAPQ